MLFTEIKGERALWVVDDLFTQEECRELIALAESTEIKDKDKPWHVPDNKNTGIYMRAIRWSEPLAAKIWDKVKPMLPEVYDGRKLLYVNPCIRFSRYRDGGRFSLHRDGRNSDLNGPDGWSTESAFTINIFLNDGFEGGETDFFHEPSGHPKKMKLRMSVEPKAGRAAVFDVENLHRGNIVRPTENAEFKYLMRTDVQAIQM